MADQENCKDIQLLKSTSISVFVDEALQDMLVVTYELGVKIFKGILLDYTKKNLPHGISKLHPAFTVNTKPNCDDDVLYSVNQRFAYTDPNLTKPKNIRIPSKYKNNKMTVRLRPRQVLCSKCKGICNENSENVSKKRKSQENVQTPLSKRSANAPITRSVYSEQLGKKKINEQKLQPTLIPKLSRLLPRDISDALNGKGTCVNNVNDKEKKDHSVQHSDNLNYSHPKTVVQSLTPEGVIKSVKRTLRKKRSIGSMEDLWDESVFEEGVNLKNEGGIITDNFNSNSNLCTNTRTIKISYGPQGEGTVLKIPAPLDKFNASDDSEENINLTHQISNKNLDNKAARKALKRARKKARQKRLLSGNSPNHANAMSPRNTIGNASPRYTVASASSRQCIISNSPTQISKKHKHKLKRKKKHRDDKDRKHKEDEVILVGQDALEKEQAVTQKLSINLKRLQDNYKPSSDKEKEGCEDDEEENSSSDEQNEEAPNFPSPNGPLILHVNTQTVNSALGADGNRLIAGDVVWGKIHGFPWWPAKILTLTCSGKQGPQAHVSWYASSTSSLIQCDQLSLYLENFKVRHNKKKKGAYKDAIRQATIEAKETAELKVKTDAGIVSPSSQNIIKVSPPTLASPREIDVVS